MTKFAQKSSRMKKIRSDYDWAIKKFYLSAKHMSLRATYKMMLMQKYLDENGRLRVNAPSWDAFRQYFYKNKYYKTLKNGSPKSCPVTNRIAVPSLYLLRHRRKSQKYIR